MPHDHDHSSPDRNIFSYIADLAKGVHQRVDSVESKIRIPTHPFYDSNNFPDEAAYGQIVVDKDDPSSLWVYGKDDAWHQVGGQTLVPPQPASMPIPVSLNNIVRYPGGVVGLRALHYIADGATSDSDGLLRSGTWLNPSQGTLVRCSGGFSDAVVFSPIEDFGWADATYGTIWIGYRVRSGTGQIKALSADYTASGGVLWPGGDVGVSLPTSDHFGYQGMGFGFFGAYSARYHAGNPVTIQASGNVDIDWIMGIPSSGYYFYGGQNPVGTASQRSDFPQFAADPSMFLGDGYGYDTQKRNSTWQDTFTISEVDLGWINNLVNDKNTVYAVYIMARSHKNGWDYVGSDAGPAILSWFENASIKTGFTFAGNGAWVPIYMGLYHIAQNDYQLAGWIPNETYFNGSVNVSTQPDEVRWQRIMYIPVRKSLSAESIGSHVGGSTIGS